MIQLRSLRPAVLGIQQNGRPEVIAVNRISQAGKTLELADGLSWGDHTFRVTDKDSAGNTASNTIVVQAGDRNYLPAVNK